MSFSHREHSGTPEPQRTLSEGEAKGLLEDSGFAVPVFCVVTDPQAAVESAEEIGYPVAVKVHSRSITHKSGWEGGEGVHLNLRSASEVREAAGTIFETGRKKSIQPEILVEEHVETKERGLELIIGGLRTPTFGPVLMFGAGGVFTEVYEDTGYLLAPFSVAEAKSALSHLRCSSLFDGYRNVPAVDRDALSRFLSEIGSFIINQHQIREMDLNPVFVREDEQVILDAMLIEDGDRQESGS